MGPRRGRRTEPEVRFVARRRHGPGRRLLLVVGMLLVSGGGLVAADATFWGQSGDPAPGPGAVDATAAGEGTAAGATAPVERPATPAFGGVGDLVLRLPSTETLVVGYHEASRTGALEIDPVGTAVSNANTTRFDPPSVDPAGADYHVMSSRGRTLPPTSAVDLVLARGDTVLSPVDGTVTLVREYRLYGQHADTRVEIRPAAAPHLRVVMIHLDDVQVRRGDTVTASRTPLATSANQFPFASHVDRYLDDRHPHVHLEVKDPRRADSAD